MMTFAAALWVGTPVLLADTVVNECLTTGTVIKADSYISSCHQPVDPAPAVIDGDQSTYWLAGRRKTSLVVTFPKPVSLCQSYWFHAEAPAGTIDERGLKDYDITTSLEGKTWVEAVCVRNYKGGRKHDTFSARETRHVRLKTRGVQGFLLPVLCEWELYGTARPIPEDEQAWAHGVLPTPKPKPTPISAQITSSKMLYQPDENVRLTVNLNNERDMPARLKVSLRLQRGVGEPQTVTVWNTELKAYSERELVSTLRGAH